MKGISGTAEITWNEHLFMEPRGVDRQDAEDAKIRIKVMDKGFFKDVLLGEFDFDMSFIYFKKDHVLLHKWLALSNPAGENFSDITAYLKVSISVSASGDEQVQITEDEALEEDTDVLMSPALNPEFYQIKIRIFQGQNLPAMDSSLMGSKSIDAYV